jgi:hypothetical protein
MEGLVMDGWVVLGVVAILAAAMVTSLAIALHGVPPRDRPRVLKELAGCFRAVRGWIAPSTSKADVSENE